MIGIHQIRTLWPEKRGFSLDRTDEDDEYVFIHFLSSVDTLSNGKSLKLKEGACILYEKHARRCFSSPDSDLLHDWCHIGGDLTEILKKYDLRTNTPYYPADDEMITAVMRDAEIEFIQQKKYCDQVCLALFERMFALISRLSKNTQSHIKSEKAENLIKLRTEVFLKFAEDWSVEKMAHAVGMSTSRFYNSYKNIFGIPPQKDLQNTRIEHAKRMLSTSEKSVEEIAELCGYNSVYNFIRQFKKVCGNTPGQLRHLSM